MCTAHSSFFKKKRNQEKFWCKVRHSHLILSEYLELCTRISTCFNHNKPTVRPFQGIAVKLSFITSSCLEKIQEYAIQKRYFIKIEVTKPISMNPSKVQQFKISEIAQLSNIFEKKRIEQLANKTKFVQRKSQLTGLDFFLLCVFAHQQNHQISLEGLSNSLLKSGKRITRQGLQERFNDNAVLFMSSALEILLQKKLNPPIVKHAQFRRIVIWDSTAFQLPASYCVKYKGCGGGGSSAGIKLQYCYDLLSQNIVLLVVQSGISGDNNQELGNIEKGPCPFRVGDFI